MRRGTEEKVVHTGQAVGWYRCDGKDCPICGAEKEPVCPACAKPVFADSIEQQLAEARAQAFKEAAAIARNLKVFNSYDEAGLKRLIAAAIEKALEPK